MLFQWLPHVINQESHVYSWDLGKIYLAHFLNFWNLPPFTREISKFQKSELGKFIPNFLLKDVVTSTYCSYNAFIKIRAILKLDTAIIMHNELILYLSLILKGKTNRDPVYRIQIKNKKTVTWKIIVIWRWSVLFWKYVHPNHGDRRLN